ncbi:MAG: tripartite tricarboxylate transporter TctB family protein [Christensenellaceae bacterium]|nr:tripartite tricarboxylate transporter TctB family protein [Christensenellaceae bacterium]
MHNLIKNKNIKQSIFIFSLGLALGIYSLVNHYTSRVKSPWIMSPYLFPLLIACFTILVSISLFYEAKQEINVDSTEKVSENNNQNIEINLKETAKDKVNYKNVFLVIILSIVYYIFMPIISFIPASILYIAILMIIIGAKKLLSIGLISIVSTLIIYFVFSTLLSVRLP